MSLPYSTQTIEEDDIEAVTDVLRSGYLTGGPAIKVFEEALAEYTGAKYAIVVSHGTAALQLAIAALQDVHGPLETGMVPPVTFAATANAVLYNQVAVDFIDTHPNTGRLDERLLASRIQAAPGPGVILPVSLTGTVCDMERIYATAQQHKWYVIEDAAHSLGATYHDAAGNTYRSGSCVHSDLAILSFHPVKHICTGEGGAVLTNDPRLAEQVRLLRSHAIIRPNRPGEPQWNYEQVGLSYNFRITDIQAALGVSQMKKLPRFIEQRRTLAKRYCEILREEPFNRVLEVAAYDPGGAYHLYPVLFKNPELRDEAFEFLKSWGVGSQVHYKPIHTFPYYSSLGYDQSLVGAEYYGASTLSIPLYPKLLEDEQNLVIDSLQQFCLNHTSYAQVDPSPSALNQQAVASGSSQA